ERALRIHQLQRGHRRRRIHRDTELRDRPRASPDPRLESIRPIPVLSQRDAGKLDGADQFNRGRSEAGRAPVALELAMNERQIITLTPQLDVVYRHRLAFSG